MSVEVFIDERYNGRYSAHVKYEPWGDDDPIPYLVTIFDAEGDTKMIAYWRGSPDECSDELTRWVDSIERGENLDD